jgi:hypothetical protein
LVSFVLILLNPDNLDDLRSLCTIIINDCATLMVLQTKGVLTRPWCLVEIYTAIKNNVPLVSVAVDNGGYDFMAAVDLLSSLKKNLAIANPGAVEMLEDHAKALDLPSVDEIGTTIVAVLPNIISKPLNPNGDGLVLKAQLQVIANTCLKLYKASLSPEALEAAEVEAAMKGAAALQAQAQQQAQQQAQVQQQMMQQQQALAQQQAMAQQQQEMAQQPSTVVQVTVPQGLSPGMQFPIETANGQQHVVTVPQGVFGGQAIQVQVGAPQQQWG